MIKRIHFSQSPTKKQQSLKFFRFPSLKMDNVSITASIPTSGYAPGQVIPLQIDVSNGSNKCITEFKVELNKVSRNCESWPFLHMLFIKYFVFIFLPKVFVYFDSVRKQSKKHKSMLTSTFIDGCSANTCTVHMAELAVPPVPPTDVVCSKILKIHYELQVIKMYPIMWQQWLMHGNLFVLLLDKQRAIVNKPIVYDKTGCFC